MFFEVRTKLCSFALPLALFALMQGGSCAKSGVAGNLNATGGATNVVVASNANGAGGESQTNAKRGEGDSLKAAAKGVWGGRHVRLNVGDEGADIEFDCAHGSMEKLVLDASGNFNVSGFYVPERGGPVSIDEKERRIPARYSGRVEGESMNLTVTLENADGGPEPMSFTLTHGKDSRLVKCL